jgi:hypothetical protein
MIGTAALSAAFVVFAAAGAQADAATTPRVSAKCASGAIGMGDAATAVLRDLIRPPRVVNIGITANSVNFNS